ncbi:hypothetical protein ABOM_011613 [Aspergillus bombycis]|uniref:Uncharacterized protein n=1 Tax=Aspergillus bombycis TaxID=109264 RepID=A0A1F7ZK13_9EURO|nr:hypothetical protein ABOM_011613 [Aspergillus bombycis]OGM39781.1 hypothetical protein ABOM_011613 [Aspergillus bombycis]
MYFSKLISAALLATFAAAAATPSNLEARQQSACRQAHSALEQASQYYKSLAEQWQGNAQAAIRQLLQQLDSEAAKVAETCAKLAEAEKGARESYSDAERAVSDRFS